MKQSLIRKGFQKSQNIFSQSKQQVILKCKHCSSSAVKVITPNGTILCYCCNESCNFSGKIISLFIKQKTEKSILNTYILSINQMGILKKARKKVKGARKKVTSEVKSKVTVAHKAGKKRRAKRKK